MRPLEFRFRTPLAEHHWFLPIGLRGFFFIVNISHKIGIDVGIQGTSLIL